MNEVLCYEKSLKQLKWESTLSVAQGLNYYCLLTSCSSRDESRVQEVHDGLVLDAVRGFLVTLGVAHNVLSVFCEGIQTHCVILRLALIAIQSKSCKKHQRDHPIINTCWNLMHIFKCIYWFHQKLNLIQIENTNFAVFYALLPVFISFCYSLRKSFTHIEIW